MNQIVATDDRPKQKQIIEVIDAVPLLDTSRFEHMQRIATAMARSTLIPDSLREEGGKNDKQDLPFERVASNCFLIVNQAVRWGLDPFSVAQAVSVVHGKLCYEGKLVAAVIQAKLGFNLHHLFVGEGDAMRIYLSDKPFTDDVLPLLKPNCRLPGMRLLDGSVAEWKTTGTGTPWTPKNFVRMLIYRGTRDWCRIYEPALMLGVYTPDEMMDMSENARATRAKEVAVPSVMQRLQQRQSDPQSGEGFSKDFVTSETETLASGSNNEEQDTPAEVASSGSVEGGERSVLSGSTLINSEEESAPVDDQPEQTETTPVAVELTVAEREGLKEYINQCRNSVGPDPSVIVSVAKGYADMFTSDLAKAKARTITERFIAVCKEEETGIRAVQYSCSIIGVEPAELDEVA
ncbi:recombinase RecT [Brucella ciceri]|uniref:recombinase RecT n=1 Tax=Brucella ciceri TaxID=391287 RepID=UPI001F1299BF|nr:recombinase RecT [Brucella ciceri]MCH6203887.1 recombinase RecT [Brucella ciceri]